MAIVASGKSSRKSDSSRNSVMSLHHPDQPARRRPDQPHPENPMMAPHSRIDDARRRAGRANLRPALENVLKPIDQTSAPARNASKKPEQRRGSRISLGRKHSPAEARPEGQRRRIRQPENQTGANRARITRAFVRCRPCRAPRNASIAILQRKSPPSRPMASSREDAPASAASPEKASSAQTPSPARAPTCTRNAWPKTGGHAATQALGVHDARRCRVRNAQHQRNNRNASHHRALSRQAGTIKPRLLVNP